MRIVCGLDVHKDSKLIFILNSKGEIFEKKDGYRKQPQEEKED